MILDTTPAPTGYDDVYHMKTMDFEEFLWAIGDTTLMPAIKKMFENKNKQER